MTVTSKKILEIQTLAQKIRPLQDSGQKIIHCHGVFDLLHIGHIRYFTQAKSMGDILVVTLTPDQFVDKGPHRPAFSETLRAEAIASLATVDYVAINLWPTAEETLRLLHPDIYVKGSEFKQLNNDMTGKIGAEAKVVAEIGAKIAFTEDIVFSSSNLINRYLSSLPEDVNDYLKIFRQRHTVNEVMAAVDDLENRRALIIGDTILDEYHYCEAIGKSSKDPVLAVKHQTSDIFAGGVLAVANHVANFVDQVTLVTVIGDHDRQEEFIRAQLHPHVTPHFITKPNSPTLTKRRFIDGDSGNKLFEVYVMEDSFLPKKIDMRLGQLLEQEMTNHDVVIAADFGHGTISANTIDLLCEKSPYLAVNTQANSSNRGFNTISRYPRADCVCLAEHEIRLEKRKRHGQLRPMMEDLAQELQTDKLVITRGRRGCLVLGHDNFIAVPTFVQNVVDRVGAGDSLFAMTALTAASGCSNEILGFLGNIAGSLAVKILGNQHAIDKMSVKKCVTSLLK